MGTLATITTQTTARCKPMGNFLIRIPVMSVIGMLVATVKGAARVNPS